jgi:hypothetical protein
LSRDDIVLRHGKDKNTEQLQRLLQNLRTALASTSAAVTIADDASLEVSDPSATDGRRIEVRVLAIADVEVSFHAPDKPGSPFEQIIVGDIAEAEEVQAAVVDFVSDLVAERVILAMDDRVFKGGRQFIPVADIDAPASSTHVWRVSWRGTYDQDSLQPRRP